MRLDIKISKDLQMFTIMSNFHRLAHERMHILDRVPACKAKESVSAH